MSPAQTNKKHWKLIEGTLNLSMSKEWETARAEWFTNNIYEASDDDLETCVCTHHPIKEVIEVKNYKNKNIMIIGNCCINILLGKNFNLIFAALKNNKINKEIIQKAYSEYIITTWEFNFLKNVWRKRKFTERQDEIFTNLNTKILAHYRKEHHNGRL